MKIIQRFFVFIVIFGTQPYSIFAMTVNTCYLLISDIINKDQNGYLSPLEFNRLINAAQAEYINFLLGTFQNFQVGRAQSKVQYSQTRITRQALTPAIYGYVLSVNSAGLAPYPADYIVGDAMWSVYGNANIRYVQQQQLDSYVNSSIDEVDDNPIFLIEDIGFRFYPNDIGSAKLSYVRNPPAIKWNYATDGNGREVYTAAGSVDPIWSDVEMMDVISRMLRMMGVILQANQVAQYASEIKQTGQ